MIGLLTIFLLASQSIQIEVVVDYDKQPYAALIQTLGKKAIENSDNCDDQVAHITSVVDPILNRNVFAYTLHVHNGYVDGDRCFGDYSRQRCETSVQNTSAQWMKGYKGKTFTYAWKLYLDPQFKATYQFSHLHQIKLGGTDVGDPNVTLTARTTDVQLQNQGAILTKTPLASFKGTWIQIREKITYDAQGCLEFTAHRMSDGYLLMSYNGCDVKLDNNGYMIRPKFGFYRSLQNAANLRDETIKIVDLCIGQNDACFYDQNGNRYDPKDKQNLTSQ